MESLNQEQKSPAGGNVVRMSGAKLNTADPVGPGIKKGSYNPSITYVVTMVNGIPQEAKPVGGGYKKGGEVMFDKAEEIPEYVSPPTKIFNKAYLMKKTMPKLKRMTGKELNNLKSYGFDVKKGSYKDKEIYLAEISEENGQVIGVREKGYQAGGEVEGPADMAEDAIEAPGSESEESMKNGTFDAYKDKGVSEDLVNQGNDLEDRIQTVAESGDANQADQFVQEIKDFVSAVEASREEAMQTGDPELMRALKEMLGEAKDLQASLENIMRDNGSSYGMAGAENNPEGTIKRIGATKIATA